MYLCKVTGTVVATRKQESLRPAKMLVVHQVDEHGDVLAEAKEMLALDPKYGAGIGDYVLVVREGKAVAQLMGSEAVSANVVIVGVVDAWSYEA